MKVVILHQHFKTPEGGGAIRSYYLAHALQQNGIRTVVISASGGPEKQESVDGFLVHYLCVPYDNRFGFGRRITAFLMFALKAVRLARLHRDADLVYAISTPLTTGLAARAIRKFFRIPYIFEVGDLWPDAPIAMGFVKNPMLKRFLYHMERKIYQEALLIVALSPAIREVIMAKVSGKPVHVIPNMADTDFFRPQEKPRDLESKLAVREKLVVSYIGALGVANGLRYFLDCALATQARHLSVHFILCGDGAMLEELQAYAKKLHLINTTFVPFQNRDGVREILAITDINFVCYLPVKLLETGSPNKYFDGLAAGKATVANFSGWLRQEIETDECGIYVNPENAGDFPQKIKELMDDEGRLQRYKQRARLLAEERYSRRRLSQLFVQICRSAPGLHEP